MGISTVNYSIREYYVTLRVSDKGDTSYEIRMDQFDRTPVSRGLAASEKEAREIVKRVVRKLDNS